MGQRRGSTGTLLKTVLVLGLERLGQGAYFCKPETSLGLGSLGEEQEVGGLTFFEN